MQVIGIDAQEVDERESKLLLTSVSIPLQPHKLSDAELNTLQERGIDKKVLHNMGCIPSYNSRVLNLSRLRDCYNGIDSFDRDLQ